jgi:hypothetical protein
MRSDFYWVCTRFPSILFDSIVSTG